MTKIKVNGDVCLCCGQCWSNHDDIFECGENGACVKADANLTDEAAINEAIENCPVGAIVKEEEK